MKKISGAGSASEEVFFGNVEVRVEGGVTLFATRPTMSLSDLLGVILHQK